jgi:hypothetical protein
VLVWLLAKAFFIKGNRGVSRFGAKAPPYEKPTTPPQAAAAGGVGRPK